MNILRRFGLAICATILAISLFGMAWSHVGVATVRNRETVKGWLDESGFYDKVVDTVLENTKKQQDEQDGGDELPVDDPKVQAIAKDAFNADFLRENVEKVLNGTYAWLEGQTDKPVFVIDMTEAKQRLADGLGNYGAERAASLPACTPAQLQELSADFDALNAPCLPPGISPQTAGAELQNEVLSNEDFLSDTSFTGDDIGANEQGQTNDAQFKAAQSAYKLWGYAPYIFGALIVLASVAIFFLSSSKRRGLRRVSVIFIVGGVVLGITYLVFERSSSWIDRRVSDLSGETNAGRELAGGLVHAITQDVNGLLMWYALGFGALGLIGLLITIFVKRPKAPDLKQSADPEPPTDDSPQKPVPMKRSGSSAPTGTPGTAPVVKKPKPPTKIQL